MAVSTESVGVTVRAIFFDALLGVGPFLAPPALRILSPMEMWCLSKPLWMVVKTQWLAMSADICSSGMSSRATQPLTSSPNCLFASFIHFMISAGLSNGAISHVLPSTLSSQSVLAEAGEELGHERFVLSPRGGNYNVGGSADAELAHEAEALGGYGCGEVLLTGVENPINVQENKLGGAGDPLDALSVKL
eukprot:CAMPEP_0182493200 /NCGR_PEP_ID=MMETSP1321-20130603/2195_1 /TAXON_ID=91990 /ORGANISM="Bolidomonas sp., Strain RCC1657" /LENGTH=190 /DNA_ID=CAMNT_0024695897 /DNA_START=111 /DNA_END=682 /DNA_ORIENTATION=-